MRLDLHNHTVPAVRNSLFARLTGNSHEKLGEFYPQIVQYHRLDGIAVTNCHDVSTALALREKYPEHTIAGSEYRVMIGENCSAQLAVLDVEETLHARLMNARLRGLEYFTSILNERGQPHFLVHPGWGISEGHPRTCELFDSVLSRCRAIEVTNAEDGGFASALALYYGLAPIGGSHHLVSVTGSRAFTEAPEAKTFAEFFDAMRAGKVQAGVSGSGAIARRWKNNYLRKLQEIWHSEIGWHREAILDVGESVFSNLASWLPDHYYTQERASWRKRILGLRRKFVEYLELRETRRTLAVEQPVEEKKKAWEEAMARIRTCFG